jgi:hypothetical protein
MTFLGHELLPFLSAYSTKKNIHHLAIMNRQYWHQHLYNGSVAFIILILHLCLHLIDSQVSELDYKGKQAQIHMM